MKTIYLAAVMAPALPLSALPQGNRKHRLHVPMVSLPAR
jgi:hypothetical protein